MNVVEYNKWKNVFKNNKYVWHRRSFKGQCGDRGGTVVKVLRYKSEGRWFDSRWCHWNFSFRSHYGPGVDSPSNGNEYQGNFLGINAAGAYGWQPYHLPVPLSWNLGTLTSWNPLGHSRPVTGLLYLKGQCNTDGYYVDPISFLFIVSTDTCNWRSKHWNLLRVIQVTAKESWIQFVTDMTKYFSPGV